MFEVLGYIMYVSFMCSLFLLNLYMWHFSNMFICFPYSLFLWCIWCVPCSVYGVSHVQYMVWVPWIAFIVSNCLYMLFISKHVMFFLFVLHISVDSLGILFGKCHFCYIYVFGTGEERQKQIHGIFLDMFLSVSHPFICVI
jgi:hypothetical protein